MCPQLPVFAQCPIFQDVENPKPFLSEEAAGNSLVHFTFLHCMYHLLHLNLAASSLKEIDMNFLRGEECLRLVLVHFSFVESHVVRAGPPLDPHRRTGRQFCALGPEAALLLLDYYCAREKVAIGKSGQLVER